MRPAQVPENPHNIPQVLDHVLHGERPRRSSRFPRIFQEWDGLLR